MIKLKDIRIGNYVSEDIITSRSDEKYYRIELNDLIYHHNMIPIKITKEWCEKFGMEITDERTHPSSNYDWIARIDGLKIVGDKNKISVFHSFGGVLTLLEHIKYIHQIQNLYYFYYNTEIDE